METMHVLPSLGSWGGGAHKCQHSQRPEAWRCSCIPPRTPEIAEGSQVQLISKPCLIGGLHTTANPLLSATGWGRQEKEKSTQNLNPGPGPNHQLGVGKGKWRYLLRGLRDPKPSQNSCGGGGCSGWLLHPLMTDPVWLLSSGLPSASY